MILIIDCILLYTDCNNRDETIKFNDESNRASNERDEFEWEWDGAEASPVR